MGDRVAETALRNGWAGAGIRGAVHDHDWSAAQDFGVAALGITSRSPARRGEGEVGEAVSLGGGVAQLGNQVAVDADGVAFLAAALMA